MVRKIIAVAAALMLCGCVAAQPEERALQAADEETIEATEDAREKLPFQYEAVTAYQRLWESFETADNGDVIYPDDYAGSYIDDKNYFVVVLTTEDTSAYEYLQEEFSCVLFKKAQYSLSYMLSVQDSIYDELTEEQQKALTCTGVNQQDNYVSVEFDDTLAELPEDRDCIRFGRGSRAVILQ